MRFEGEVGPTAILYPEYPMAWVEWTTEALPCQGFVAVGKPEPHTTRRRAGYVNEGDLESGPYTVVKPFCRACQRRQEEYEASRIRFYGSREAWEEAERLQAEWYAKEEEKN